MAGELDEIIVHTVGQCVDVVLVAVDHVDGMPVEMMQNVQRAHHARARKARHGADGVRRGGERQRGRGKEFFVELGELVVDVLADLLIVLDEDAGELFKLPAHRQEQDRGGKAEDRVDVRDGAGGHRLPPQAVERARMVQDGQRRDDDNGGAEVEDNVDDARALGVRLRADGADDGGGHAVADVHADDDGVDRAEGQRARHGKRLQDTDGRRRALNEEGYARTGEEAEHRRVGKAGEHLCKRGRLTQRTDRCGHVQKAGKEDAEAHRDAADGVAVRRLDGHDEEDARDGRKGRERGGLEQIEPRAAVGVEVEQTDDLTRDGRADVRAEDDADGLVQCQHARADKARGEHDGRRRALNDRRDRKAEQEADERIVRHLLHRCLERTGRALLQAVAHELHTVEKQRQPAEERNKVKNRHTVTNLLCVPDPYFTVPVAEMAYCAKLHQILW